MEKILFLWDAIFFIDQFTPLVMLRVLILKKEKNFLYGGGGAVDSSDE